MFRYLLLLISCCLFFGYANAQQNFKAKVLEYKTTIPLAGISVVNLKNKKSTVTDNNGQFTIPAAVNDLIVLSGFAYEKDTLMVIDLKPREIFLEPAKNMLKQVDIYTREINLGLNYDPEFHNQTVVYQRDAAGNKKGGIAFRFWTSKKGEHDRDRQIKNQADEEVRLKMDKIFSSPNLSKYLPLKPIEMEEFKVRYIPSVAVYTSKNFHMLLYLDSCYKEFLKLPPEKRLVEKLVN